MSVPFTVGFDLDMTLIDSRPGIRDCYAELSAQTGVPIDAELVVSRLGPPLEHELANWFPADQVPTMADRYREMYPDYAVTGSFELPGARAATAAVRALGGRAIVITGKYEPNAKLHLTHLDIAVDAVIGDLWAEQKAEALCDYDAQVYVGDHIGDMRGARTAGAYAVGVPTGPCDADELRAAGADVILADLTGFPAWLDEWLE